MTRLYRKCAVWLAFMLLASLQVEALEETTEHVPILAVDTTSVDLGVITAGAPSHAEFTVQNTGNDLLALELQNTSCSCLNVGLDSFVLAPQETHVVSITVETITPGSYSAYAIFKTNDQSHPELQLNISANAVAACYVHPDTLYYFGKNEDDSDEEPGINVDVLAAPDAPEFQILDIEIGHAFLSVRDKEKILKVRRKNHTIQIILHDEISPASAVTAIRLRTDSPRVPLIEIPVYIGVDSQYYLIPQTNTKTQFEESAKVNHTICDLEVVRKDAKPFSIVDVKLAKSLLEDKAELNSIEVLQGPESRNSIKARFVVMHPNPEHVSSVSITVNQGTKTEVLQYEVNNKTALNR